MVEARQSGWPAGPLEIIDAPSGLGLRPPQPGHEPGTWRAPQALRAAGLHSRLNAAREASLPKPVYRADAEPGTRLRNGHALRAFNEAVASEVRISLKRGGFPLVIGGDCSILIGCLAAARADGPLGLIHVDGHSDFRHPGNYDPDTTLGAAGGMDLALATGRGEALLTHWGQDVDPLVDDSDVVQIGEREDQDADYAFPDIFKTDIHRFDIRKTLAMGVAEVARQALALIERERLWLHTDLDVLDAKILPAVDSPGSPGLDYAQLELLLTTLLDSDRVIGADVAIFDPDLDPDGTHARAIATSLAAAFS
jgi:arginase